MTPKSAWENIKDYIPKDKVIWEAFMGDGKSGEYLRELGFNVIHNDNDFFENDEGDVIVSNPPFSNKNKTMNRLKELDKPFIILLPQPAINTTSIRELFKNDLQIIIPRKRIQFIKNGNELQNKCNFDCFYYCYKMNLPRDIIWLE
jgi:hypothetical protein